MENLKPFNPQDIDETLTRVVPYGETNYLLFPYINALGAEPRFDSVSQATGGARATVKEFAALSARIAQAGYQADWFLSFNTPWLIKRTEANQVRERASAVRQRR